MSKNGIKVNENFVVNVITHTQGYTLTLPAQITKKWSVGENVIQKLYIGLSIGLSVVPVLSWYLDIYIVLIIMIIAIILVLFDLGWMGVGP